MLDAAWQRSPTRAYCHRTTTCYNWWRTLTTRWFGLLVNSINDLAAIIRGRRLSLGLSQEQVATRTGVSRQWVSELERGKPTAELGLVLGLLDALELNFELVVREGEGRLTVSVDLDAVLDEHRGL
jgi:HTH-type transcriptional regulator / antitoxin HipB